MCLTFWDLFDWIEIAYHKKYKNEIHSKTLYQYFYALFIHGSTDFGIPAMFYFRSLAGFD